MACTGSEVAESRKKLKRSQAARARNAGIGRATVEALENGRAGESGFAKVTKLLAAVGLEVGTTPLKRDCSAGKARAAAPSPNLPATVEARTVSVTMPVRLPSWSVPFGRRRFSR
ncbi:MAG TPA: hypothetical protein VME43_19190 [Bryobacteraceae bacterium]|nr:hypothetical protein [Bryobacteraceae bacterium]